MDRFLHHAQTPDGVVVLCNTKEESLEFFKLLDIELCGFDRGRSSNVGYYHDKYGDGVCYSICDLCLPSDGSIGYYKFGWCDLTYYAFRGRTIIAFSDISRSKDLGEFDVADCSIESLIGLGVNVL